LAKYPVFRGVLGSEVVSVRFIKEIDWQKNIQIRGVIENDRGPGYLAHV
jgi:hypothetical protein